jgi:[protein-PII] uridylyltransferase
VIPAPELIGAMPELPSVGDGAADLSTIAKEYLAAVHQTIAARHRSGASGRAVVSVYTDAIDRLIAFLFESATAEYTSRYVLADHRCTIAAQGGYGRRELNPASDIDLLVLYPWRVNAYVETVAERILYTLWDAGLTVGHASRTIAACTQLAQKDFKVKTALLDARFLCGDPTLYAEFEDAMEAEVLKKNAARFYREKLGESRDRHQRYGDSIYLLEPQLKEGPGGLRDIHTAMWLAKVKYKVKGTRELVLKGVINDRELAELEASQDFVFRVRNALHILTGTHQDLLSFEFQDRIAEELGFREENGRPIAEPFMKTYFTHASAVQRFSDAVIERVLERPYPYRLFGRVVGREIREGIWILNGTLSVTGPEDLRRDPTNLVTLFRDSQRHGVELTQGTKRLIREHLELIGEAERSDPRFMRPFLDVLRWKHNVYETLRELHSTGVLCALFPEFSRIDCLVQRNLYHIYTVDEHSLVGIRELERLRRGELKDFAPLLTEVMRDIERHDLLFLAMLFHDIGKGHGGGHAERGADYVRRIAGRLGLNEDDTAQWELLVRHHLLMSHLAQHRDTHDPRLVAEFARTVGSADSLRLLYVLTFADMRAVGPKVWNNWRDTLLGELYMQALALFEQGQLVEVDLAERLARIRARLLGAVDRGHRAAFETFLTTMPDGYLTSTPEAQIPQHFELMQRLRNEWGVRPVSEHRHLFVTTLRHYPEAEYSELTICTPDRPGLFAMITGVLTAHGMNIAAARITTSRGGVALDSFRISHIDQREMVLEPERWERVEAVLAKVLRGDVDVESLVAASRRPSILERKTGARTPTHVIADNTVAEHFTVLDVVTQDRVGVLFTITHALHRLGIVIHLAKIATQVHQVFDVFYVTDGDGAKLTDTAQLDTVRGEITRQLEELATPPAVGAAAG